MIELHFSAEQEAAIRQAAAAEGVTAEEFIIRAIDARLERPQRSNPTRKLSKAASLRELGELIDSQRRNT